MKGDRRTLSSDRVGATSEGGNALGGRASALGVDRDELRRPLPVSGEIPGEGGRDVAQGFDEFCGAGCSLVAELCVVRQTIGEQKHGVARRCLAVDGHAVETLIGGGTQRTT